MEVQLLITATFLLDATTCSSRTCHGPLKLKLIYDVSYYHYLPIRIVWAATNNNMDLHLTTSSIPKLEVAVDGM